jgi:Tfp pilus assembly PilM family ATPase
MIEVTPKAEPEPIPIESAAAPAAAPSATPVPSSAPIRSGRLHLELGTGYLLWCVTESKYLGSPQVLSGSFTDPRLSDPNVFASHLDKMIETTSLRYGDVDLYLSLPEAMLRSYYVPAVPKNELKQVVLWEAGKVFPFALEKELFAWRVVGTVEWSGNRKYQIQVAAVPSARITPICELLAAKGLTIRNVTLTALVWEPVIADLTAKVKKSTPCCAAVVRLLGNRLSVFCFSRGVLEFVRENVIELTGKEGSFEASLRYLEDTTSETRLDSPAAAQYDPESVSRIVLDNLDYYYGRFTQRNVSNIVLATPPNVYQPLAKSLHEMLGVTVHPAFGDTDETKPSQKTSLRLLAPQQGRTLRRSRPLNLIPSTFRAAAQQQQHFRFATYAASLLLTVAILVSVFQQATLAHLRSNLVLKQSTLNEIKNSKPYLDITAQVGERSQWNAQLALLRKKSSEHSTILRSLSIATPPDMYLNTINLQTVQDAAGKPADVVSIAGFVTENGHILELRLAEYLKALSELPYCRKIELTNQNTTVSDKGKHLEFSIAMECGS